MLISPLQRVVTSVFRGKSREVSFISSANSVAGESSGPGIRFKLELSPEEVEYNDNFDDRYLLYTIPKSLGYVEKIDIEGRLFDPRDVYIKTSDRVSQFSIGGGFEDHPDIHCTDEWSSDSDVTLLMTHSNILTSTMFDSSYTLFVPFRNMNGDGVMCMLNDMTDSKKNRIIETEIVY